MPSLGGSKLLRPLAVKKDPASGVAGREEDGCRLLVTEGEALADKKKKKRGRIVGSCPSTRPDQIRRKIGASRGPRNI